MKTTLGELGTSLRRLKDKLRNDQEISQNHFGDYLMYEHEWVKFGDNYKIWLSNPENVKLGQAIWQIEYCGPANDYKWEIISEGNN